MDLIIENIIDNDDFMSRLKICPYWGTFLRLFLNLYEWLWPLPQDKTAKMGEVGEARRQDGQLPHVAGEGLVETSA